MTVEELKNEIYDCVDIHFLDSILFYTQEYSNIMSKQDILTEFFLAMTELCHNVDEYFKEEEEDCD